MPKNYTTGWGEKKRCQEPIPGAGILIACSVLSRGVAYSRVDHFAGGSDAASSPLARDVSSLRPGRVPWQLSANPYAPDSTANPFGAGSLSVPCLSGLFDSVGLSGSV